MLQKIVGGQYVHTWTGAAHDAIIADPFNMTMQEIVNRSTDLGNVTTNDFSGICISPDGANIIIGSFGAPYHRIIDVETRQYAASLASAPSGVVYSIRFSPDGSEFAMAMNGSPFVSRWSYPGLVRQPEAAVSPLGQCNRVSYSPDGTMLAVASNVSPYFKLYSIPAMVDITPTMADPPTAACFALSFSSDNTHVCIGGSATGSNTRVYDVTTGTRVLTSTSDIYSASFSPDGSKLLVASQGNSNGVIIYETTGWTVAKEIDFGSPLVSTLFTSSYVRGVDFFDNDYFFVHGERGCGYFNYTSGLPLLDRQSVTPLSGNGEMFMSPSTAARKIAGTVTDGAAGALARVIKVFDADTETLVGETTSDAVTGAFETVIFTSDLVTVVAYGEGGELAQIIDGVSPAVI